MARCIRPLRIRGARLTVSELPTARRVLFIFLDGVGIGHPDTALNPLAVADLPTLHTLLGGTRLTQAADGRATFSAPGVELKSIDANLGVDGRPQSGTGQGTLLTGINLADRLGRHFGPWVPTGVRDVLARSSLFQIAGAEDLSVAFANAYPASDHAPGGRGERRPGAFPFAAKAANLLTCDEGSVRRGEALVSSITTDSWRKYVDPAAPEVLPFEAGERLAGIAATHDLTLFAHYDTDYVGHRGDLAAAVGVLRRIDAFLAGVLTHLPSDSLLLVTSDHGNLEDLSTGHTRNPVPLIVVGEGATLLAGQVEAITDVAPSIMRMLRKEWRPGIEEGLRPEAI